MYCTYSLISRLHRIPGSPHTSTEHVPNLVSVQQFCLKCENLEDIEQDCVQCGKRKHTFGDDPVRISYLYEPRPWVKIVANAHNAKSFHLPFILN